MFLVPPCSECLEELGTLIQDNGMVVCGSQPQETLPFIAQQITDRDHTVRSAALNAMVIVYGNIGDGVYKFTSQVSLLLYNQGVYLLAAVDTRRLLDTLVTRNRM